MVFESQDRQTREEAAFFYRGDSETIAEGVVFFPSFGTSTAFVCDDRILVVDTTAAPGARAFRADAEARGPPRPRIVAHRDLPARFDRYRLLGPQNDFINRVQFNPPEDAPPYPNATWVS